MSDPLHDTLSVGAACTVSEGHWLDTSSDQKQWRFDELTQSSHEACGDGAIDRSMIEARGSCRDGSKTHHPIYPPRFFDIRMRTGRTYAPGVAEGEVLLLSEPLSFYGGVDVESGEIIDHSHPDRGKNVAGKILVMPSGRGSSSSSSVLAELIRLNTGSVGILLERPRSMISAVPSWWRRSRTSPMATGCGSSLIGGPKQRFAQRQSRWTSDQKPNPDLTPNLRNFLMFEGIFTAVVAPMADDGSLIFDLWEAQVRRQIDAGIHGLIIGGTTGESYALTPAERAEQFRRASAITGKSTPWLAGVNALTTREVVALAKEAKAAGAHGLLLAAPPYVSPTQLELAAHCIEVDKAADLPIVLYNYPGRTNVDMGEDFWAAIKGRPNFVQVKESTGDMKRAVGMLRNHPQIKLCCGAEDLALDFLVWGARMWICAASNFIPEKIVAFYDACVVKGDFATGRKLALEFADLMDALEEGGKFIAAVKYACSRAGICSPVVRGPIGQLTSDEAASLDTLLADLGVRRVKAAA
jgi:4-hydroxy-tetrahydrodipicolinate synthase